MQSEKPSFARFGKSMNVPSSVGARSFATEPVSSVHQNGEGVHSADTLAKSSKKTARLFEAVISFSLGALFFGLPLFFTGATFQGIAFDKQMYFYFWLLIGLVAWVSKGVSSGDMRIRRTPLDIPIVLFWLFSLIAAFLDRKSVV